MTEFYVATTDHSYEGTECYTTTIFKVKSEVRLIRFKILFCSYILEFKKLIFPLRNIGIHIVHHYRFHLYQSIFYIPL